LITAFVAAFIALTQNDIKKVLAYSTVSQLGYMFLGLGVGAFTGAFFHVLTHAFFKALLFLGAGSVIHAMHDEQDMRKMGGLRKALPLTFITMLIGTVAISGIPPFSGFFSKDEILAHAFAYSPLVWGVGLLTALLTAFYMFRLLYLTFFGSFRGTDDQKRHLHESPWQMTVPLFILAGLSVIGGFLNVPEVLGGHHWLGSFLEPIFELSSIHSISLSLSHSTEYILMATSSLGAILMAIYAYNKYVTKQGVPLEDGKDSSILYKISYNKFYFDEIYNTIIEKPLNGLSEIFYRYVDKLAIDGFVNGLGQFFVTSGKGLRQLQNGQIGFYLLMMVVSIIVILIYGISSI